MAGLFLVLFEFLLPVVFIFSIVYFVFYIKKHLQQKEEAKHIQSEVSAYEKRKEQRYGDFISFYSDDLNKVINPYINQLPIESHLTFKNIKTTIDYLSKKPKNEISKDDQYMLADIIYKHIPDLIDQYTTIPVELQKTPNDQGKTPIQVFTENLEVISSKCTQISQNLINDSLSELKSQQNHLKTKFTQS